MVGGTGPAAATIPLMAESGIYAIRGRVFKEDAAGANIFTHGNGTKLLLIAYAATEEIQYYDGSFRGTGQYPSYNTWHLLEVLNINFTSGTFDVYLNGSLIKSGASMRASATAANTVRIQGDADADQDVWLDNFIVRNWRAIEPAWGSWGSEEYNPPLEADQTEAVILTDTFEPLHLVDQTAEQVTVTDQFDGDMNRRNVTEQVTMTDEMKGFDYHGKQAETVTITDSMGRAIEAERAVEETITFSDEMEPLHLVDANTEAVTLGDSFVADEMIRKKTRHPRLQGKHLSLKFSSSAHGSFAVYYLRAKVHKTIAVERRPLHPNLQGRHLSLKISHGAAAEFKAYYASAKMAATRGLSNSVHPNAQGSHIGLTIRHAAAEAFRMDYASMRLLQVKR